MMTFDWNDNAFSDEPSQRKNGHLIRLHDGNYTIQTKQQDYFGEILLLPPEEPIMDWPVHTRTYSSELYHKKNKGDNFHY